MDMFILAWTNGRGTCLNITETNPLLKDTVCQFAVEGDYAVILSNSNKVRKFQAACTTAGLAFFPLAVDTFGGWHKEALAIITRLGTQLASNVDGEPGEQVRFLGQHLAISLAKDCSQMLATQMPTYTLGHVNGPLDMT